MSRYISQLPSAFWRQAIKISALVRSIWHDMKRYDIDVDKLSRYINSSFHAEKKNNFENEIYCGAHDVTNDQLQFYLWAAWQRVERSTQYQGGLVSGLSSLTFFFFRWTMSLPGWGNVSISRACFSIRFFNSSTLLIQSNRILNWILYLINTFSTSSECR